MSKRQPELLVGDIIDSGNKILSYTQALTFEQFVGDSKTVDAVIRNFEIIGTRSSCCHFRSKKLYSHSHINERVTSFKNSNDFIN